MGSLVVVASSKTPYGRIDSYNGRIISSLDFEKNETEKTQALKWGLIGKHAVYFEFLSETGTQEFDRFTFN